MALSVAKVSNRLLVVKSKTMTLTSDELKARISRGFGNIEAPRRAEISLASDWDAQNITKDFSLGLDQPVQPWVLERYAKSLPAFTPRAFVFFLKDYMLYGVEHPSSEVTENLIYRLSSVQMGDSYWKERMNLLSVDQRQLVAMCCTFLQQQLPPIEAVLHERLNDAIHVWRACAGETGVRS